MITENLNKTQLAEKILKNNYFFGEDYLVFLVIQLIQPHIQFFYVLKLYSKFCVNLTIACDLIFKLG